MSENTKENEARKELLEILAEAEKDVDGMFDELRALIKSQNKQRKSTEHTNGASFCVLMLF